MGFYTGDDEVTDIGESDNDKEDENEDDDDDDAFEDE